MVWMFLLLSTSTNSAYLLGSKCITFVICIYIFCFFGRVSSTLTSLALTILHCYTNQAIESNSGPSETYSAFALLPEYSVRNMFLVDLPASKPGLTKLSNNFYEFFIVQNSFLLHLSSLEISSIFSYRFFSLVLCDDINTPRTIYGLIF